MSVLKGAFALEAIQCLKQLREKYRLKVFAYCVMPEHIHLLLAPGNNKVSISRIIQGFKSMTTRLYNLNGRHEKLWQRYFYDHIVRREEDLNHVALYILENPVRKGLARRWEEWPYCGIVDPIE
jgi:putative transposase